MRFLIIIAQLVIAYYLGSFIGQQSFYYKGISFIIFLYSGLFYFFYLPLEKRFFIFVLTVFISFSVPERIPIHFLKDIISPFLFLSIILQLLMNKQPLFSRKAALFFSAVGILAFWALISYIKNPILGQTTFGVSERQGGLQDYYAIFSGITTFLCSFWFFRSKDLNEDKLLLTLLLLAVIVGNIRVVGYYRDANLWFLGGSYSSYKPINETLFDAISGLKQVALVGFSVIGAILYRRRWNLFYFLIVINLLVLTILSGGRAPALGIVFGIIMYILFINRKFIIPFIFVFIFPLIIIMTYTNINISKTAESKYGKIAAFEGGLEKQSSDRYYNFLYMWEIFEEYPIFGKGIGYKPVTNNEFFNKYPKAVELREGIENAIRSGSHGSYSSILAIFGIGGAFWFLTMLYGGIFYAYRVIKKNGYYSKLAVFAFLNLSMASVHLIVGNSGYDVSELWFLPGMIGGLMARGEKQEYKIVEEKKEYQGERLMWAEE